MKVHCKFDALAKAAEELLIPMPIRVSLSVCNNSSTCIMLLRRLTLIGKKSRGIETCGQNVDLVIHSTFLTRKFLRNSS